MGSERPHFGDGASPGKIFIGGLSGETTLDAFVKYFGKYGEIIDSVVMKDRFTGRFRGFGFITYADPAVVDTVIAETHIVCGKQVEIKRTIPKGSVDSKEFNSKKIFVGGIPTAVTEDELKGFFSKFGEVVKHEIIRDRMSKRSRGFGFIVFNSQQVVDNLISNGNMIDMAGSLVEIKKAEPKKPLYPTPAPGYGSNSTGRNSYGDSYGGFDYESGGVSPTSYRSAGSGFGRRFDNYGGYGSGSEFGGRYGDYGNAEFAYRGQGLLGYSSRFGSYGGGYRGMYGGGLGAYGRGGGYGRYGGGDPGGSYDSGPGAGYGGAGGYYGGQSGYGGGSYDSSPGAGYGGAGGYYGGQSGYGGGRRYHPYGR